MTEENIKQQLVNYISFIKNALDEVVNCYHEGKKETALMHIGALVANVRNVNSQLDQFRPQPEIVPQPDIKPEEKVE